MSDPAKTAAPNGESGEDIAALAKGGRTNVFGFLLRLLARLPFLFIAGQLYGAEAVGIYAYALLGVELTALVCSIGEKRGLAQRLSEGKTTSTSLIADSMLVALIFAGLAAALFFIFPAPLFPNGMSSDLDRWIVFAIPGYALTEIALAAQAYKYDIATTVRARAVVEPWTISILAGAFWFVPAIGDAGLAMAYLASIYAGLATALVPFFKSYGLPRGWTPRPERIAHMVVRAMPLAVTDAIEWGTRRVDLLILGWFAGPVAVGIYYMAQQVASLPQKLKTSFEPILGPVITARLKEKDYAAIAKQVCQVGFWIVAAQAGIALALGIPGEALMGLFGDDGEFVPGTAALAFLLAAEVVAATAVVSEAALVYVARVRNLWVSVGTIAFQAVLTIAAMMAIDTIDFADTQRADYYRASAAAGSLMLALGFASLVKASMLSRILGHSINNWRWALVWASAAAVLVGQLIILLPEWAELALGVPAILAVYGWIIWTRGFGAEDRVLFRKKKLDEPLEQAG
ncbi:polysaccharide biosynthesis protein [Aurantiacibacter atlanticus]|uniref:Polysaccharide biosynthesis protein n=1 Tax=Aurantiacibacter atlanticus TaxID=1648404 RepID=A0A0H4VFZ2_9SPHN|nr:oligosaccharide flippase family protein [Aurantiacibacter atlanticus]AKQ41726.1 polysaccharide biosynthesis protein [Aurantiacibacter atlanticus]MDF1833820.1 oligosaccharide flippase family protein [Alteraurantiacibacter sp. bin_em_oilr2.035]